MLETSENTKEKILSEWIKKTEDRIETLENISGIKRCEHWTYCKYYDPTSVVCNREFQRCIINQKKVKKK